MYKYKLVITFTTNNPIRKDDIRIIDDDVLDGFDVFRPKYEVDGNVEIRNVSLIELVKLRK